MTSHLDLESLSGGSRGETRHDVVTMLVTCHDKIRRFLKSAQRLASDEAAPDHDVAQAAHALVRYFTEALPRHSQDEDLSLRPRLGATDLDAALADLEREHREIDGFLARLIPTWSALAAVPAERPGLVAGLRGDTEALSVLLARHLAWEEDHLFPRLEELLGRDALDAVAVEMRARRDEA